MKRRRCDRSSARVYVSGRQAPHAQMAVIDVSAIVQMAQQLRVLQDQLVNARSQLTQAQAQFERTHRLARHGAPARRCDSELPSARLGGV